MMLTKSPFALVCHSDLSKANIDAPNGLLGHCRRVKKCLKEKERQNIVTLGLKMRKTEKSKGDPIYWNSVDSLRMLDEDEFPLKAYYLDRVMPEVSRIPANDCQRKLSFHLAGMQQRPAEPESELPFRSSTRNYPSFNEKPGYHTRTSESETSDVEEDDQHIDYGRDYKAVQLLPEAQGQPRFAFPPSHYYEQIPGPETLHQQSMVNKPTGSGEPSSAITTTSVEFSPYSSGTLERNLFVSQPHTQSCAAPFLVPGSRGPASDVNAVATISYPPGSVQIPLHIQGAAHSPMPSPDASTPGSTPVPQVTEGGLDIPEALITNTAPSIRRSKSNPRLTMTHSLPLPLHVSPPLNPPIRSAIVSNRRDGHSHSVLTSHHGSSGMTESPTLSSHRQLHNDHLGAESEGYPYPNLPSNITIGGCPPTTNKQPPQQGHTHPAPSPFPPAIPPPPISLPVVPRIAMPSPRALTLHPLASSSHNQSLEHTVASVQAMHSLHQPSSYPDNAALARQLAGGMYPQSSLLHSYSTLAPGWEGNVGTAPNLEGLGMWMGTEEQRTSGANSPSSAKGWTTPSTRGLLGGFGLQPLAKSGGNSFDTLVQRSSSTVPRNPSSFLGYSSSQTAATNRLPSHNALGLLSAHNNIHSQELSTVVPLPTGFNGPSSTSSHFGDTSHPENLETAQALGYSLIAMPGSRDEVGGDGVAYFDAPRSLTRAESEAQIMSRSQLAHTETTSDRLAYGTINSMRSRDTGNYELVPRSNGSSFQSDGKRSAMFNGHQGLVPPHQQRFVQGHGGDLTWTTPPSNTGPIPTRGSGNENSIAAASLEVQSLMTNKSGRAQLARRMQAGGS
ncbi:hypothetical protein FRC01_009818 [Tulasnella sp. 417]|nr:hypothetical protein FRC01_009818 [Tulasnella sp. 417]